MKKLRYGIISAANIAPRFISAIQQTAHSEVVAIASRSLPKAQHLAKSFNIPKVYDSYQQLYQDPDVDIVYICNLNDDHATQIQTALGHRKHVVCEKPLVLKADEVTNLFDFARKQNCFLMEAQKSVFLPTTQLVKQAIQQQTYGRLKLIDLSLSFDGKTFDDDHWMYDAQQGGCWIPSGNYCLELLAYLLEGFPNKLQSLHHRHHRGAIDEISLNLQYHDILAHCFISMRVLTDNTIRFYFEKGIIEIQNFWKAKSLTIHSQQHHQTQSFDVPFEMVYEVDHIANCLKQKLITSPIMSEMMSYQCVKIVEQVNQHLDVCCLEY